MERWGRGTDRRVVFIDPVGGIHADATRPRPRPELPDRPVKALIEEHDRLGVEPTGWALRARHERAADAPWPLRARAAEALDAAHFGE